MATKCERKMGMKKKCKVAWTLRKIIRVISLTKVRSL